MKKDKLTNAIRKSPINYFSDLFVFAMVIAWIVVGAIMTVSAIYSMIFLQDNSVWSDVCSLIGGPVSAGGAIWMLKNSVQHAIMNYKGKTCPTDFPAVNAEGQDEGNEAILNCSEEE